MLCGCHRSRFCRTGVWNSAPRLDIHPSDRAHDVQDLQSLVPLAVLTGIFVGAIARFAARLLQKGLHLVPSTAIVVGCAALARLSTVVQPRYKGSPEPSFVPAAVAALVGGVIVLWFGMFATRRAAATDVKKANNDQPHNLSSVDQPDG
jgi:hypothetical protein